MTREEIFNDHCSGIKTAQKNLPRRVVHQRADDADRRGFSRPVRAQQGIEIPRFNLQVEKRYLMTIALELKQLKKTYPGGVQALRGIDLQVEAGRFF
jgi:hypothetical protein